LSAPAANPQAALSATTSNGELQYCLSGALANVIVDSQSCFSHFPKVLSAESRDRMARRFLCPPGCPTNHAITISVEVRWRALAVLKAGRNEPAGMPWYMQVTTLCHVPTANGLPGSDAFTNAAPFQHHRLHLRLALSSRVPLLAAWSPGLTPR
jgi:hypothetical protein